MGGNRITTEGPLVFERLSPADFERMCLALLAAEGHTKVRNWGAAGSEDGCDLISRDPAGKVVVTQCKRVGKLSPSDAEKELRKVLQKPPQPAPEVWALATTQQALSRKLEERLVKVAAGKLEIELYGLNELDRRLRNHPDLVAEFFGSATAAAAEAPVWWVSAAEVDQAWAEPFAEDLMACLKQVRSDASVELAIPSKDTPWPAPPSKARWGLVLVTPEALADSSLRKLWSGPLCDPAAFGGQRRLLALSLETTPWPTWLKEKFERVDLGENAEQYRIDLSKIISKYIGENEKNLPVTLKGPGRRASRLPAELRRRFVTWLEPAMSRQPVYRLLASALELEHRKVLDDLETPELRASTALSLAISGIDPIDAALRMIDVLREELTEEREDRLEALSDLAQDLRNLREARREPPMTSGVLTAWRHHVERSNAHLTAAFDRPGAPRLLDHIYVELRLADRELSRPGGRSKTEPEDEALLTRAGKLGGRWTLEEILGLDPTDFPPEAITGRWLLYGDPGSGKTTLLRHLAWKLARENAGGDRCWLPVFASLPRLVRSKGWFLETLCDDHQVTNHGPEALRTALDVEGRAGRLLLLFDGLDEVPAELHGRADALLGECSDRWPDSPVVVTSRPIGGHRPGPEYRELQLLPFNEEDRLKFLDAWLGDAALARSALSRVRTEPSLWELSGNPLYLTLLAMLLADKVEIPERRSALYRRILNHLVNGKYRKHRPKIPRPALVRRVLRQLADAMTEAGRDSEPFEELEDRLWSLDGLAEELSRVGRWRERPDVFLEEVAERTSILAAHDGPGADWRYWHRTFREALAAEALTDQLARQGEEALLARARGIEGDLGRWAEPWALVVGQLAEPDRWVETLMEVNRPLGLRALSSAQGLAEQTFDKLLGLTEDWKERAQVFRQIPEQLGDAPSSLRLIDRLRRRTTEVHDLFFLEESARRVSERWPESERAAEELCERFFADRAAPPEELFSGVDTPRDGPVSLWSQIDSGSFLMGSPDSEPDYDEETQPLGAFSFERPQHEVRITRPLRMMVVPVTQAMYQTFDPSHGLERWDGVEESDLGHHPVVNVDWYEAVAFCRWLRRHGFAGARLPTEAEWEYACRAGTTTRFWSGDAEEDLERIGWYGANARSRTHRVGEKPASPWELYDMHGNVWEWCADRWDDGAYARRAERPSVEDPMIDGDVWNIEEDRVLRGGAWGNPPLDLRAACRLGHWPWDRLRNFGFRVVCGSGPEHVDS